MYNEIKFKQTGMTLIEILVAVFVVSIGLLGVARMEILAKQSNSEAIQRTSASQLAHDMVEKMRSNPKQLSAYVGQILGTGSVSMGTDCDATACTPTEIAAWDLFQWDQSLIGAGEKSGTNNTGGLDTPRGCIAGPAAGGPGQYTVSIAWRSNTPMPDKSPDACGQGKNLYGNADEYRRVLTLNLYISDDGI